MGKYIIDTDKHISPFDGLILTSVGGLEELNSEYVFAHFGEEIGAAEDRAALREYERGYKDGMDFSIGDAEKKNAYEDGYKKCEKDYADSIEDLLNNTRNASMNRAWECAKRIASGVENGGLTIDELSYIFNRIYISKIFQDFSAQEAIEKIEAYEEEMANEIHVNDEVQMGDLTGIVFKIEDGVAYGICNNTPQFTPFRWAINECQKLRSNVISADEFMKDVADA